MGQRVEIGGHPTWVDERGSGEETVLLLHGGMSNSDVLLDGFGDPLAERHRVVAFDRRGHGYTGDTPAPFHYENMALETIGVLEQSSAVGPTWSAGAGAHASRRRSRVGPVPQRGTGVGGGLHVMSCAAQPEEGNWANADPNTRSLTRASLRFICQDQVLNGQLYPPGPPWYMHLWGACTPTDCDWGEVGAQVVTVGTRTYVHAVYHQGFATRYVYADMSLYRAGQLWIWMWTDFADAGRADYESQNWFTRV